ncbi:homeobox-leucine zipper protein HAT4 isoform X2 [Eucalyptus grandis]|uniref:homeobox-leucine zipper protein HAT4 isoform X2 n=1 Tax=Eucalyptus grandis TaxID=71139 RepID=UPI00192EC0D9|nr:homeobox-leucine zipper protein HAT4 isoform X2 [Eucalyptus grandis]
MGERDDLGLSLSLSFPQGHLHQQQQQQQQRQSLQLNLMPSLVPSSASSAQSGFNLQKRSCNDAFPSSSDRNSEARSFLRGIDVNREPSAGAAADYGEDEAGVSSPNSMASTVSGKRSERDHQSQTNGDDLDNERASSRGGGSDEEDGDMSRKKLRLSKDQSAVLEESFKEHNTLNPKQKLALAKQLGLRPRQVEVWFQNRRARTKLKQTEVDCEYLKRCCESLTEENRRLQKEVQELRALKLSPQFYMHLSPPTTLTMCPSCERVAAPSPPPPSAAPSPPSRPTPAPCPSSTHGPLRPPHWPTPRSTPSAPVRERGGAVGVGFGVMGILVILRGTVSGSKELEKLYKFWSSVLVSKDMVCRKMRFWRVYNVLYRDPSSFP